MSDVDKDIEVENDNVSLTQPPITKKDPKRVEQGKRLAAISREAKERKMREKIEAEYNEKYNSRPNYSSFIIPVASAFGVFSFFYMWLSMQQSQSKAQNKVPQQSGAQNEQSTQSASKFETFE